LQALGRAGELGGAGGFYALETAIIACHAQAITADDIDWPRITGLYPPVMASATGMPPRSVFMWIIAEKPPRDLPSAGVSCPLFRPPRTHAPRATEAHRWSSIAIRTARSFARNLRGKVE